MKKFLSLLFFVAFAVFANAQIALRGELTSADTEEYTPNALRFTFENNTGKAIANCNFQFTLPEGVSIKKKSNGKYQYAKGDATEDMESFSIAYSEKNGKYTVAVYGGVFDEEAGNCIIELPLQGELTGEVKVTNIAFGDPDGNDFGSVDNFTIKLGEVITGSVTLKGEVKDNKLVFSYANTTGRAIANCSFQLQLPDGMGLVPNGSTYQYEKGDATSGMTFSVTSVSGRYTVTLRGGTFNESAGSTVITLPLQGDTGGKATVSSIAFSTSDGISLGKPNAFTMDIPSTAPVGSVELKGGVEDGSLVFTFENTTGKTISNCNFQFSLPAGMSLVPNGSTYQYTKGDATAALTYSVTFSGNRYSVRVTGGNFNETAGNTIIRLPLQGKTGGKATVSNISFGDAGGNVIGQPGAFTMDVPAIDNGGGQTGGIELKGELKDGNLVFTFENTTGKTIANCNFQITLPEGVSIKKKSNGKYQYTKGDATEDMESFSVAYSEKTGKYTVTVYDGEFDEEAGNTIIYLPLEGEIAGEAKVTNIAFGDPEGNDFGSVDNFTIKLGEVITGSVTLKGEV